MDTPAGRVRVELKRRLDEAFASMMFTATVARPQDPDDRSLTIEKLYEKLLELRTGKRWRVMRDGIPTRDENGEVCCHMVEAMPAFGIPEMWCASTEAADELIRLARMQNKL